MSARLLCPWDSPGKNTGAGGHFLLQGIFPTPGPNPWLLSLLHWRWVLYHSHHLGSPLSVCHSATETGCSLVICDSRGGPRGCDGEWDETEREVLCGSHYVRKLRAKQGSKYYRTNRLMDRTNKWSPDGRAEGGMKRGQKG